MFDKYHLLILLIMLHRFLISSLPIAEWRDDDIALLLGNVATFNDINDRTKDNNETVLLNNHSEANLTMTEANQTESTAPDDKKQHRFLDPSSIIRLRANDWRDNHQQRLIIWSHESQFHPDFGKMYSAGGPDADRHASRILMLTRSSRVMSFMILGSVIGFVMYTYLSHVLMVRRIQQENKTMQLRELVHRSAMIMAGSTSHEIDFNGRRRSLINMFQKFKL